MNFKGTSNDETKSSLFQDAIVNLDNKVSKSNETKKQIIVKLAKDLDGKIPTDSIATDKTDILKTNSEIIIDQAYNNLQIQNSINSFISETNYTKAFENKTNRRPKQQLISRYIPPSLDKENKVITTSNDKNNSVAKNNYYNIHDNGKDYNLKQGNEVSKIYKNIDTPLKRVTSVPDPPSYPCMYCNNYSTNIDFDMEIHLHQYHRRQILDLKIKGDLDKREEYVVAYMKRKMLETARPADEGSERE